MARLPYSPDIGATNHHDSAAQIVDSFEQSYRNFEVDLEREEVTIPRRFRGLERHALLCGCIDRRRQVLVQRSAAVTVEELRTKRRLSVCVRTP